MAAEVEWKDDDDVLAEEEEERKIGDQIFLD
jgi:hypothetical protein